MTQHDKDKYFGQLREQAEQRLQPQTPSSERISEADALRVTHELNVHQVELEMQNDQLRQSQQELEESRNKYTDLFDYAPVGYFVLDRDNLITEINLTGASLLGIERNRLLGKPFTRQLHKEDQDTFYLNRREVFKTGLCRRCVVKMVRSGHEDFFGELLIDPIASGGVVTHCRIALIDRTAQRKAEMALQDSEERFRTIFEGCTDGMLVTDSVTATFFMANEAICTLLGYSREEMTRLSVNDIHPEADLPGITELFQKQAAGEAAVTANVPVQRKDGSVFFADISATPIVLGGKTYLVGSFRDVTERKQAQEKIESLSRFPEENPFPVLRLSADGTILYSNRPGRCLLDAWNSDVGRKAPPDWCKLVLNALDAKQYQVEDVECGQRKFSCAIAPSVDGEYVNIYGRDVTAQKTAETNQTLLTQVLQILNRSDNIQPLIRETLNHIQTVSGFDAVGLRIRKDKDFPYFEYNGFSQEFIEHENRLCAKDECGAPLCDPQGNPVLECTCGLVLSGRIDPAHPNCTPYGSFWTNNLGNLTAFTATDDPRINPRNGCIHSRYQSIGLFPVKAADTIIGMLQLNDRRPDRFIPTMIAFYENLARNIGLALQRTMAEEALQKTHEELERRVEERTAQLKKAIEAVEIERKRFNDVLETLPAYVCLMTPDYQMPFANRVFREWFGYQPGKPCYEFLFNRTEPCETCETFSVLKTGRPHHWEWTGPNGCNYDIYDFPFKDTDGSPMILEMGIDITVVRQAEAALRELNETLEQQVAERTESLRRSNAELTEFNNLMVDRELRMIELKNEINELCLRSDQPARYVVDGEEETV